MKKIYILPLFFVFASQVNGQSNSKNYAFGQQILSTKVQTGDKKVKPTTSGSEKSLTVLWSEDFTVTSGTTTANGTYTAAGANASYWEMGTFPHPLAAIIPSLTVGLTGDFLKWDSYNPNSNEANFATTSVFGEFVSPTIDLSASTTANNIGIAFNTQTAYCCNFQVKPFYIAFSEDDGATWTAPVAIDFGVDRNELTEDIANPLEFSMIIASYITSASSQFKFKFIWDGGVVDPNGQYNTHYSWLIDDIEIYELPANEVGVEEVFIGDIVNDFSYSIVPSEQTAPMVIGVSLSNNGSTAFNGDVNISIKQNGVEVDNFNTAASIPSASYDTLWITSTYTASTIGNYTVVASVPADEVTTNDADSSTVETSQYIWAHDFGGTTARGFNIDDENAIGNLYFPTTNGELSALNINFATGTTVGQEVEVAVYEVETNIQGNLIFLTETYYTIVAGDITAPSTTIEFGSPVTVEAGKVYLMYVKKPAGTNRMYVSGTLGDNDFATACFGPFGSGAAVNWYNGYSWAPHVRANFDPSLAIENVSMLDGVSVYPNPSEGIITVSNDNGVENTITVYDITGKKVASKVANTSTTVDLSAMGTGLYMVEVANENGKKSERVIIK